MQKIANKPQAGDVITHESGHAHATFQEYLDSLTASVESIIDQVNINIAEMEAVKRQATKAGYGVTGIETNSVSPLDDIGLLYQRLPFTRISLPAYTKGVSFDLENNTLAFKEPGIWQIILAATLQFTELNAGRTFSIRAFNVTENAPGDSTSIFVARNTAGVNMALPSQFAVDEETVDTGFTFEIGNASTPFTGVLLTDYAVSFIRVSEITR